MNERDKLGKAAWLLIGSAKDSAMTTIAAAVRDGRVKVDPTTLPFLIDLIGQSVEAGYHKAYNTFSRNVDEILRQREPVAPPVKAKKN